MSLDGALLRFIKKELDVLQNARCEKVTQPARDELLLQFHSPACGTKKLLISANAAAARICFTGAVFENPAAASMCLQLFRKWLAGARLTGIKQDGLERIITLYFDCVNDVGDIEKVALITEIMGRSSNIILARLDGDSQQWRVIEAVKRVTDEISSVRRVLPGGNYLPPPRQDRLLPTDFSEEELRNALTCIKSADIPMAKALIRIFEGISPIFSREAVCYACHDTDITPADFLAKDGGGNNIKKLAFFIKSAVNSESPAFTIVAEVSGGIRKYRDFTFVPVRQYAGAGAVVSFEKPTASALVGDFFEEQAESCRRSQMSGDIMKRVVTATGRIANKLELQRGELATAKNREHFRMWGDLIMSNLYAIKPGQTELTAENYITNAVEKIPLVIPEKKLTPSQMANRYYAEYRRLSAAEKQLEKQIADGENELLYLDSVFDAAGRAISPAEIEEIRAELIGTGYIKDKSGGLKQKRNKKTKQAKQPKALPPLIFTAKSGQEILVGRNNRQNDRLTFSTADPGDIWLHVKNIAGSHVIVRAGGQSVTDETLLEAAKLAAFYSKARQSAGVPVDYVPVKFVKKPAGSRPGYVIFTNNRTLYVKPDEQLTIDN